MAACGPGNFTASRTCDCPWPWGSGDMVPLGSSCDVNLVAVRFMWIADACLMGVSLALVVRFLFVVRTSNSKGSRFGRTIFGCLGALTCAFALSLAVYKAILPGSYIGVDLTPSILLTFHGSTLFIFILAIIARMVVMTSSIQMFNFDDRNSTWITKLVLLYSRQVGAFLFAYTLAISPAPLYVMAADDASKIAVTSVFIFWGVGLFVFATGFVSNLFVLRPLLSSLNTHLSTTSPNHVNKDSREQMARCVDKMEQFGGQIAVNALISSIAYCAIGSVEAAVRYTSYILALSPLSVVPVVVGACILFWPTPAANISRQRIPSQFASSIKLHSQREGAVLLRRNGEQAFSKADEASLDAVLHNGDLLDDSGGGVVSIAMNNVLVVDEFDTVFASYFPGRARLIHAIVAKKISSSNQAYVIFFIILVLGIIFANLTFVGFWPSVAIPFVIVPAILLNIIIWTVTLNRTLFLMVIKTKYNRARNLSVLVSGACFIACLQDLRIIIILLSFCVHGYAVAMDALTGPFRSFLKFTLIFLVLTDFSFLMIIYFNFLQVSSLSITISSSFDFNLLQLARDLTIGICIVALFDLAFAFGNKRRLAHIHRKVEFILIPLSDGGAPLPSLGKFLVNASRANVESGFIIKQPSEMSNISYDETLQQPAVKPIKLFVDILAIKQYDALILHALGTNVGASVFRALQSRVALAAETLAGLGFAVGLFGAPFIPELAYAALAFPVVHVVRHFALSSLAMIRLLVKLREFWIQLFFIVLWFALSVVAFSDTPALIVQVGMVSMSVSELFRDAYLQPVTRLRRIVPQIRLFVCFTFVACAMIWDLDKTQHAYVDFEPSTAAARMNGTLSYSDDQSVVDLNQECVDLAMVLALNHLWGTWDSAQGKISELSLFRTPVTAVFTDGSRITAPEAGNGAVNPLFVPGGSSP